MKRRLLFWLIILLFTWILVDRFAEIQRLVETLANGQGVWVLAALFLTAGYSLARAWLYQSAFAAVGVQSRIRELIPVLFGSLFANLALPLAGAGGAAIFIDDLSNRGQSSARTAAGMVLNNAADEAVFTVILASGMAYLFAHRQLHTFEILTALAFLVFLFTLSGLLLLSAWKPGHLRSLLTRFQEKLNRLSARLQRDPFVDDAWALTTAEDLTAASNTILNQPKILGRTAVAAFVSHLINLAILYSLFQAFHQPISPGALIAGYAIGIVVWIVSITPQGIGFVEGAMAFVFIALGISAEKAVVITLAFRGLIFWLPLVIGFFLLRNVKTFTHEKLSRLEVWGERSMALLAGLISLTKISTLVSPSLPQKLIAGLLFLVSDFRYIAQLSVALLGVVLFFLALNLTRQR